MLPYAELIRFLWPSILLLGTTVCIFGDPNSSSAQNECTTKGVDVVSRKEEGVNRR